MGGSNRSINWATATAQAKYSILSGIVRTLTLEPFLVEYDLVPRNFNNVNILKV